jgi:methyl-accepting chemotaxis protein
MDEFNRAATTLSEALQPFIKQQTATVTSNVELITETVHTLVTREFWGVLFLITVLVSSGWLLALSITRPLKIGVALIRALAEGDLTQKKLGRISDDEIGQLLQALDSMYQRLAEIVTEVHRAADDIANASHHISDNNVRLSKTTEENASMLNQATESMNELASTVGATANDASEASKLANKAKSIAAEGALAVSNTIGAMDQLDHGSQKISGTIGVIDDIAFQTNLLALNASIEAAQAGDKGKGFAVVASEVRQLALRSADAAHDIKRVIEESTRRVETFSAQVDASGEALAEIVGSVKQVSEVMSKIAQANIELSHNIEQINRAMTRMNDVTSRNNDIVRLTARGALTLNDQAGRLSELMNFFKLDAIRLVDSDGEDR